jgi:hypothetical protein
VDAESVKPSSILTREGGGAPSTTVPLTLQVLKLSMQLYHSTRVTGAERMFGERVKQVAVYLSEQARSASYLTLV